MDDFKQLPQTRFIPCRLLFFFCCIREQTILFRLEILFSERHENEYGGGLDEESDFVCFRHRVEEMTLFERGNENCNLNSSLYEFRDCVWRNEWRMAAM